MFTSCVNERIIRKNRLAGGVCFDILRAVGTFSIYSFLGWAWRSCSARSGTGKLVNRGFLNGPCARIYGFGMVMLAVLGRFSDNIALLFFGGMVLTSALELAGGWALKKFFHTTWWDYSKSR